MCCHTSGRCATAQPLLETSGGMMSKLLLAGVVAGLRSPRPWAPGAASFRYHALRGLHEVRQPRVSGPLGTSLRNAGGAVYGAEATLGLTRGVALVGNVAYAAGPRDRRAPHRRALGRPELRAAVRRGASAPRAGDRRHFRIARSSRPAPARCVSRSRSARSPPLDQSRLQRRRGGRHRVGPRLGPAADGEGLHREVRRPGSHGHRT